VLAHLRKVVDGFANRVLVAEMGLPPSRVARYHKAIDVPLNFGLITEPWTAERLERRIRAYLEALPEGASVNWVLGNHDVPRVATRLGDELAHAAAVILMTLPGTLTLYYGDELGLPDHPSPPRPPRDALGRLDSMRSRDPQRAPMPWDSSPGAASCRPVARSVVARSSMAPLGGDRRRARRDGQRRSRPGRSSHGRTP
jgi:alpha-glucosidase